MPSAVAVKPTHDDGTTIRPAREQDAVAVRALLAGAQAGGAQELVLLTTTADAWFPRFGFERMSRDAAPASLRASEEFRGACPASAVVMRLRF